MLFKHVVEDEKHHNILRTIIKGDFILVFMNVRAHIFISGRVQGVFFRSKARWEANKQNVKGWVKNLTDGRVEAVLEGEKENVEEMIEFCRKGPPLARVENVDVRWKEYKEEFQSFKICHF